ncbi:uncharacterized protein METZ01_LOCUS323153, partial [marine metagenome]
TILCSQIRKQSICDGGYFKKHFHLIGWKHSDFKGFWNI